MRKMFVNIRKISNVLEKKNTKKKKNWMMIKVHQFLRNRSKNEYDNFKIVSKKI